MTGTFLRQILDFTNSSDHLLSGPTLRQRGRQHEQPHRWRGSRSPPSPTWLSEAQPRKTWPWLLKAKRWKYLKTHTHFPPMTWAELPMNQWVQLKIHLLLDCGWGLSTGKYVNWLLRFYNGTLSLLWEAGRRWVSKQQSPKQDVGSPGWKSENTQLDDHRKISW